MGDKWLSKQVADAFNKSMLGRRAAIRNDFHKLVEAHVVPWCKRALDAMNSVIKAVKG